jgi:hypothetical protein
LKKFSKEINQIADFIAQTDLNPLVMISASQLSQFKNKQHRITQNSLNCWKRLWHALSIERASWQSPRNQLIQWKRDQTPCFAFVPMKMRRKREKWK